jgi:hypothetical protein
MARSRPTIVHRISTSYRWVGHPPQQAMRVGSSALRAALVIQLLLSAGSPLFAQALRSSVEGRVADQSGAVIPGAEVTLTNLETGETRTFSSWGFFRERRFRQARTSKATLVEPSASQGFLHASRRSRSTGWS